VRGDDLSRLIALAAADVKELLVLRSRIAELRPLKEQQWRVGH
jgi:hypothetical protein